MSTERILLQFAGPIVLLAGIIVAMHLVDIRIPRVQIALNLAIVIDVVWLGIVIVTAGPPKRTESDKK